MGLRWERSFGQREPIQNPCWACSVRQGHELPAEESPGPMLTAQRQEVTLVQTSERGMARLGQRMSWETPAPAEARMGPLLWKALPPGTANKSLHLPWGTDLPVLGWTKLMSRLESNMDSAQAAQDRLRDGSHTEVEQLEATACCCKAWTNPMDPRSAGPLFPQLITLFQVTALSGNQFAKFWVSPVSRLKKNTQVFSSWQGTFSPQPQQPGEMTRSKGRSLQPGAQTSNPLSRICSMPSPSLLAHPLSSSSNAPLTSCQRKIPPGKGHRPFQNGGGEHLCRGRCCRNAAWGLQNATTPLPPWLSDAEHSWGDPSAVTGMIRSDLMHVQTKVC